MPYLSNAFEISQNTMHECCLLSNDYDDKYLVDTKTSIIQMGPNTLNVG